MASEVVGSAPGPATKDSASAETAAGVQLVSPNFGVTWRGAPDVAMSWSCGGVIVDTRGDGVGRKKDMAGAAHMLISDCFGCRARPSEARSRPKSGLKVAPDLYGGHEMS